VGHYRRKYVIFAVLLGEIGKVDNVRYNSTYAYSVYGTFDRNRPLHNWRLSAILDFSKVRNLNCPYPSEGQNVSPCQISRRSVEPFRRYGRFSIFNMAAAVILDFENFKFLTVVTLLSKSLKSGLRYGDFSIFMMAAVRYLGF